MLRNLKDATLVKGELTGEDGRYSFNVQQPDLYFIEARLIGYSKATLKSLPSPTPIQDISRVSLSFNWSFGNAKVKAVRRRETAGESERDRI